MGCAPRAAGPQTPHLHLLLFDFDALRQAAAHAAAERASAMASSRGGEGESSGSDEPLDEDDAARDAARAKRDQELDVRAPRRCVPLRVA